jgi:hypothetical protein
MSAALQALQPQPGRPIRHTVPIKVVDGDDSSVEYGVIYVRQVRSFGCTVYVCKDADVATCSFLLLGWLACVDG